MRQFKKNEIQSVFKIKWIFYSALIITLYFDVQSQDPFNSPKFWILIISSTFLFGSILTSKIKLSSESRRFFRLLTVLGISYLLVMIVSSFYAYSWKIAIFGDSFRRNGLLTYIGFIVFFLASALFVRFENILIALRIVFLAGLVTGAYALIQFSGHDWVKWSAPNQVISTFGNTNFSGAGMSIFAIIIFGLTLIQFKNKIISLIYFSTFIVLIYMITRTNARQALIMLALGLSIILLLLLHRKNKKIWQLSLSAICLIFVLALFGLFKVGPLQSFIYKSSISVREFYWRAGIEMFQQNPFLGVGPDHYGVYFKEFRDPAYPLAYGWGITSSNAHNIFIQNFATGGLFLGLIYLAIQVIVGLRALKLIGSTKGTQQLIAVSLFSAWIAYQAQSLVSIEFIGLSIWGWIISGTLVGLSFQNLEEGNKPSLRSSVEFNIPMVIVTTVTLILALLVVIPLRQSERSAWKLNIQFDPKNQQQTEIFNSSVTQVLNGKLTPTEYKNLAAVNLLRIGQKDKALQILNDTLNSDPRNLDTLAVLVDLNEKNGNYNSAIYYRNQIAKYDPWNAQNYLGLAQLYKVSNDLINMKMMVDKILSFASSDPIAEVAKKEFIQNSN